ncbi:TPA: restriction endonuclease subunit S [Staphylococcus aureus]|uniref:restriction endonuclease subunit S n=4 Tax=Staphylococcus aureus TaxID=1280 RepID=UPI00090F3684|nr:restriction endonuclease subunit S [Staphylococcus aureus]ELG8227214.1 restriction endonuclease subunit S [Staphylococcus aureus]MDU0425825.1 restriction endonuclease subunit S [Staphylococcus aureus]UVJ35843.1 restriction endonuclease subunit S [Staphylococcus aureus]SGS44930.1 restriction-modification enzyme type I, specificity subunit [Staphylococcus aureus]HCG2453343.1 restriction endonuclease subunit S [Staphylococcus aureus]
MSNTQKKNVPELRFPGFEGEWEDVKFVSIFQEVSNKTSDLAKYPLFSLTVEKGITPKTERYKRDFLVKKSDNFKIVEPRDIVYNPMNVTLGAIDLSKYNYDIALSGYYHVMKIINSFNPDFISNFLKTEKMIIHYKKIATGSLMEKQRVHFSEFKNIIKKFPTNKEQQKIGDFFSKIDRQIELQEQKLELLQQQKKGYMQKIFSQELRFKDENGEDYPDWKEKKLGDITEQSMYGIGASATRFDSKNIYIRITDIDEKSRKLNYQNLTTPDELNNKYKLKRNDILFARTGASTGKSYIHKEEKDIYNYYFAGFLIKFEIDEQNNPLFIYQFTLTSKFNKWVKVMSVRSGQPGINSEEYAKLPLVLPNKLEQQKIAEFLDRFDQQIELEKQKIEILQQQKKGLLQSMFI